jgi:hypothetical protein
LDHVESRQPGWIFSSLPITLNPGNQDGLRAPDSSVISRDQGLFGDHLQVLRVRVALRFRVRVRFRVALRVRVRVGD